MKMLPVSTATQASQFDTAIDCIKNTIVSGLQHGYFKCEIRSTIGKQNRREILIEAGEIHKFIVPEDDLPK